jgi:hypothetical protein
VAVRPGEPDRGLGGRRRVRRRFRTGRGRRPGRLVDFRGLDTLGEITVLTVAAIGIASLVLSARRRRGEGEEL